MKEKEISIVAGFAEAFPIYLKESKEVQKVIREMCEIANDRTVDAQSREAALVTISEALFPVPP